MTGRRIVAVDDQRDLLDIIRVMMELETDWTVATYLTVDAATDAAGPADVVLLDLSVTDGDPSGSIGRLRAATADAPVVLLTGTTLSDSEVRRIGAHGLIAKPFDVMELAANLSALLDWRPSQDHL